MVNMVVFTWTMVFETSSHCAVLFCDVFESLSFESSHRTVISFFFYQEKIILTASTMLAADSFEVLPPTYILTLATNTDVFCFHFFRTSPWLIMFHCVFLFRGSFTAPAVCLESLSWWKVKQLQSDLFQMVIYDGSKSDDSFLRS